MKVLIVGSMYPPEPLQEGATDEQKAFYDARKAEYDKIKKPQFIAACHALGAALARDDDLIRVGVTSWQMLQDGNTVASYVPLGADTVAVTDGKRHPILFDAPQEPEPSDATADSKDSLQDFKNLRNIDLQEKFVRKSRYITTDKSTGKSVEKVADRVKMIPNVTEVDAVVLVGGTYGTSGIGYAAYSMNKPVIALTAFGGTGKDMADDILFDDYNRFVKQEDVTAAEVRALSANWNANVDDAGNHANADLIVRATKSMAKAYGKANKTSLQVLLTTTVAVAVLLVAWILVYLGGSGVIDPAAQAVKTSASGAAATISVPTAAATAPATGDAAATTAGNATSTKMIAQLWSGPLAFFLLLYISALLGAGLRLLAAYQSSAITQLTFLGLWIDLVVSLVVAFGLALLYLIGSISFTGEVVVLAGTDAFANISVSMSLLGLAAGYLVPLNRLRERLEKIVAEGGA